MMNRLKYGILASSTKIVKFLLSFTNGTLYKSGDGKTFSQINQSIFQSNSINDLEYAKDLTNPTTNTYLAVANNGILAKSNRGIVWTTLTNPSTFGSSNLNVIKYGGSGNFESYMVGGLSQLRYSTNGTTWLTATISHSTDISNSTTYSQSLFNNASISSIVYANGIWGAVANNGFIGKSASASDNLGTFNSLYKKVLTYWVTQNIGSYPSVYALEMAYKNNLWILVGVLGSIRTSTNLINWVSRNSNFGNTHILSIAYGNGVWIAGGYSGQMRRSTDGTTWTTVTSNFGTSNITSIAYAGGVWLAGSRSSTGTTLRRSIDGNTWTTVNITTALPPSYSNTEIVAYGNNTWIVGNGLLARSTDNGITWTTLNNSNNYILSGNFAFTISKAIYENNIWLFVGRTQGIAAAASIGLTSTNLVTWTTIIMSTTNINTYVRPIYKNGTWFCFTEMGARVSYSTNLINWDNLSNQTADDALIVHPIWQDDTLALYSANSAFDNLKTTVNTPIESFTSIYNHNNNFLGINTSKRSYTSTDLLNWTTISPTSVNYYYSSASTVLLADSGIIYNNISGTWTTINTGVNDSLRKITYNSNIWTMYGQNSLYTSTNLVNWTTISTPSISGASDIISI